MNLKGIMKSERSQSLKTTHCMIHLHDILKKLKIWTEVLWNKEQTSSCQGLRTEAGNDYKGTAQENFQVIKLFCTQLIVMKTQFYTSPKSHKIAHRIQNKQKPISIDRQLERQIYKQINNRDGCICICIC